MVRISWTTLLIAFTAFSAIYPFVHAEKLAHIRSARHSRNINHECSKDTDCVHGHCCSSISITGNSVSTKVMWICQPLANKGGECSELKVNYCPCRSGLTCSQRRNWYFGPGLCT